jgi:probable HAF family extracellular repeat protein
MFSTAFLWSAKKGFTDLGHLGGTGAFDGSIAYDVNERGQVTGQSVAVSDADTHGFFWSEATGILTLGTLGGDHAVGIAINNSGEVAGRSTRVDGELHAFIWSREGGMRDLGTLPGGALSIAHAINNKGQAAGRADTPDGVRHAVLWTPLGEE